MKISVDRYAAFSDPGIFVCTDGASGLTLARLDELVDANENILLGERLVASDADVVEEADFLAQLVHVDCGVITGSSVQELPPVHLESSQMVELREQVDGWSSQPRFLGHYAAARSRLLQAHKCQLL
eukprot:2898642-Amphidinium_carterae.1